MGCPICGSHKMTPCGCSDEAVQLAYLREDMEASRSNDDENDEQQEKFEFLKAAAIVMTSAMCSTGSPIYMKEVVGIAHNLMNEVWKHKGKL